MKSEAEIRAYRDDLLKCIGQPCDCAGGAHAIQCYVGGKMMEDAAATLSWVLGENLDLDRRVEVMAQGARQP